MLISPKNKFIYFKPMKTAGSSIEKSLLRFCSNWALCTGGQKYSEAARKNMGLSRKDCIEYNSINNKYEDKESTGTRFHSHTWPELFKNSIKDFSIFKNYKKITSVRNPWAQIVSFYWWDMSAMDAHMMPVLITEEDSASKAKKKFHMWAETVRSYSDYSNADLKVTTTPIEYMASVNEMFLDEMITDYIVFENLQKDYNEIMKPVLNQEEDLPELEKLKSGIKKINRNYSFYYDCTIKDWTAKSFKKTIEKFNYNFVKE